MSVENLDKPPTVGVAELLPAAGQPMLMIADPYSFPADAFLEGVEGRFEGAVAVGGEACASLVRAGPYTLTGI